MGSTLPIVEVVIFRANERCLGDLGLFKEVRDMVAATTSVKAMYWGPVVELPKVIFWLLVWDSFEQSIAREGTPSHAEMVRELDALTDDPSRKLVLHMRFSDLYDPPLGCIEAPVTELDLGFIKEDSVVAEWDRRAESLMSHMRRIHAEGQEGLRALTLGRAVEDVKRTLYLVGWNSIEDHMKIGMQKGHEMIVKEGEEIFPLFHDFQMHHVHFERHA